MNDTVSVCVCTFGDKEIWDPLAQKALESVYQQTRPPDEIHRIHGNSLHEARNEGAIVSKSTWMCFLDADDELEIQYIKEMMLCEAPGLTLRYPRVRYISHAVVNAKYYPPPITLPRRPLHLGNFMVIGTLIQRNQFIKLGGFRDLPAYEDWDLWIRAWKNGAEPVLVPRAIYRAYRNKDGRNHVKDPSALTREILAYNSTHNKIIFK